MANIPVQKKQGIPWWVWLLGALLLLGLLFWNPFRERDTTAVVPAAPATPAARAPKAAASPSPAAGGVVTDLPLGQSDQLVALVGRSVQLSGIEVQEVVGDKTFWIGPSNTQRLFVFLEENPTAATKPEGKVDVNGGQTVSIEGELRRLPGAAEAQQQLGLTAQQFEDVQNEQVYLFARRVQVTGR